MTLNHQVTGSGPRSSDILLLGEAPGAEELEAKQPFVGQAGHRLRQHLFAVGLPPSTLRIENVIERKLLGNQENKLWADSKHLTPTRELEAWWSNCQQRIAQCSPKLVIALGETALRAVTFEQNIGDAHCYVIENNKIGVPVLPIYHPAALLRQPELGTWFRFGLLKAKEWLAGRRDLHHRVNSNPSVEEILNYIHEIRSARTTISIDLEKLVPRGKEAEKPNPDHRITQVGLAKSPSDALSFRLLGPQKSPVYSPEDTETIKTALAGLLADDQIRKIFQNYIFDTTVFNHFGMPCSGPFDDTMIMANVLNPELPKGLADLGRLYCYGPPWKKVKEDEKYNAFDVLRTYEIYQYQEEKLKERGLWKFYTKYMRPLFTPILSTCERGLTICPETIGKLASNVTAELEPVKKELIESAEPYITPGKKKKKLRDPENDVELDIDLDKLIEGKDPKAAKRMLMPYRKDKKTGKVYEKAYRTAVELFPRQYNPASTSQTMDVLSGMGMRIPTMKGKKTVDENALKKLLQKTSSGFIAKLLSYRKNAKIFNTYCNAKLDPDGQYRFELTPGTETLRLRSKETGWKTGGNSQNFPKNFRHVVVPQPGNEFMQVDLSQAELRVVAWLSQDVHLIDMLSNSDVHQYMADMIRENTDVEQVSRQLGKRVNHASGYGMGAKKFQLSCLMEDNIHITLDQAHKILELRHQTFPGVPRWQESIRQQLHANRKLTTPFGWERKFFGRIDDKMYRKGYMFIPQHTSVMVMHQAWAKIYGLDWLRIVQQGHDSLLLEYPKEAREGVLELVQAVFSNIHIPIGGKLYTIPHDISVGPNWRDMKELQ